MSLFKRKDKIPSASRKGKIPPEQNDFPEHFLTKQGNMPKYHNTKTSDFPKYHNTKTSEFPKYHDETSEFPKYHDETSEFPKYHDEALEFPKYHNETSDESNKYANKASEKITEDTSPVNLPKYKTSKPAKFEIESGTTNWKEPNTKLPDIGLKSKKADLEFAENADYSEQLSSPISAPKVKIDERFEKKQTNVRIVKEPYLSIKHIAEPKVQPGNDFAKWFMAKAIDTKKSEDIFRYATKHFFSAEKYLELVKIYRSAGNLLRVSSKLRQYVHITTIKALAKLHYYLPDGKIVNLPRDELIESIKKAYAIQRVYFYILRGIPKYETKIQVINGDVLSTGKTLLSEGLNPAVLISAFPDNNGADYYSDSLKSGCMEAGISRRTSLCVSLEDPYREDELHPVLYPISVTGAIYCPDVFVFRGEESEGYPFLAKFYKLSLILCSPPPHYVDDITIINNDNNNNNNSSSSSSNNNTGDDVRLLESLAADYSHKIEAIAYLALVNGHDSLVLTAFGCGTESNPTKHIAEIFSEVLSRPQYVNAFKRIVFAIIDANTFNVRNYNAFKSVLEDKK